MGPKLWRSFGQQERSLAGTVAGVDQRDCNGAALYPVAYKWKAWEVAAHHTDVFAERRAEGIAWF